MAKNYYIAISRQSGCGGDHTVDEDGNAVQSTAKKDAGETGQVQTAHF